MSQFDSIRFQPNRPLLKEISADRLNAILQEIRRVRPKSGRGISVSQTGDGTQINLSASLKGGAAGGATPQSWDIVVEDTQGEENNITYTVKVVPGTLARILPSNWNDEFTCDEDTLYYGIARVSTDGQFISGVEIDVTATAPEDQTIEKFGLNSSVDILFGLFKDGTQYNFSGGADIDVSARVAIAVSADPPGEPGQSPYDIYYKLQ